MSEYNKVITIEIHAFGLEKEPCDIVPVLLQVIDDIISRGGFVLGCSEYGGGFYILDNFSVFTKSTCPLVLSQPSILKYLQETEKSKLIKRIHFLTLMIFLTNLHGFLSSVWQWVLHHFWE